MPPTQRRPADGEHEDKALARRILDGDERAFEDFFHAYAPRLYRFALARLGQDNELAREVVQSAVCKGIESLKRYRGEASLFAWLCGICRHEILAVYKERRRMTLSLDLVEERPEIRAALESLSAMADGPDAPLERREVARLVHLALDALPVRYGRALEWKYCEGLPVKEIAERLALSPKAAESLLTRARDAFRDAFHSIGEGLAPIEGPRARGHVEGTR